MGIRVGGGGRLAGGSIGAGGVSGRVGPVSVRAGAGSNAGGKVLGLLVGVVILIALIMLIMPIALILFSSWGYRRWTRAGRPAFRRLPVSDQAALVAAGLAVPIAIVWAVLVWGGAYGNMTSHAELPPVRGGTVAEATAALMEAGFTVGDVIPTYGDALVDSTCTVRDVVASMDGRRADNRVPVTLKVRC